MYPRLVARILAGKLDAGSKLGRGERSAALPMATLPFAPGGREQSLDAARQFLADTAEAVNPGTPARDLLAYLTRYRAHLAAVVAASSGPECRASR